MDKEIRVLNKKEVDSLKMRLQFKVNKLEKEHKELHKLLESVRDSDFAPTAGHFHRGADLENDMKKLEIEIEKTQNLIDIMERGENGTI
jgi:hypothetical protein